MSRSRYILLIAMIIAAFAFTGSTHAHRAAPIAQRQLYQRPGECWFFQLTAGMTATPVPTTSASQANLIAFSASNLPQYNPPRV